MIFTNVVSNKNTDFQFYIFWGVKFNNNITVCFKEMKNILGYEKKKILLVNYYLEPRKKRVKLKN